MSKQGSKRKASMGGTIHKDSAKKHKTNQLDMSPGDIKELGDSFMHPSSCACRWCVATKPGAVPSLYDKLKAEAATLTEAERLIKQKTICYRCLKPAVHPVQSAHGGVSCLVLCESYLDAAEAKEERDKEAEAVVARLNKRACPADKDHPLLRITSQQVFWAKESAGLRCYICGNGTIDPKLLASYYMCSNIYCAHSRCDSCYETIQNAPEAARVAVRDAVQSTYERALDDKAKADAKTTSEWNAKVDARIKVKEQAEADAKTNKEAEEALTHAFDCDCKYCAHPDDCGCAMCFYRASHKAGSHLDKFKANPHPDSCICTDCINTRIPEAGDDSDDEAELRRRSDYKIRSGAKNRAEIERRNREEPGWTPMQPPPKAKTDSDDDEVRVVCSNKVKNQPCGKDKCRDCHRYWATEPKKVQLPDKCGSCGKECPDNIDGCPDCDGIEPDAEPEMCGNCDRPFPEGQDACFFCDGRESELEDEPKTKTKKGKKGKKPKAKKAKKHRSCKKPSCPDCNPKAKCDCDAEFDPSLDHDHRCATVAAKQDDEAISKKAKKHRPCKKPSCPDCNPKAKCDCDAEFDPSLGHNHKCATVWPDNVIEAIAKKAKKPKVRVCWMCGDHLDDGQESCQFCGGVSDTDEPDSVIDTIAAKLDAAKDEAREEAKTVEAGVSSSGECDCCGAEYQLFKTIVSDGSNGWTCALCLEKHIFQECTKCNLFSFEEHTKCGGCGAGGADLRPAKCKCDWCGKRDTEIFPHKGPGGADAWKGYICEPCAKTNNYKLCEKCNVYSPGFNADCCTCGHKLPKAKVKATPKPRKAPKKKSTKKGKKAKARV